MNTSSLTRIIVTTMIGTAVALGGCARAGEPPPSTATVPDLAVVEPGAYLGEAGDTVRIAVVPGNKTIKVYACGDSAAVNHQFEGAFDGTAPVTLTADPYRLTIRRTADGYSGHLIPPRGPWLSFTADPPAAGAAASGLRGGNLLVC
jgi:hypothetical protein